MAHPDVLVFIDGTCVFCNRLVAFILRRDRRNVFRIAHLQGEVAQAVLARHGLELDVDAVYAVTGFDTPDERVWLDGAAGRVIWPQLFWLAHVLKIVPLFVLDPVYRLFARFRYRLFGQADHCIVPTPEQRARFID